jgi:hypothetical protein
MEVDEVSVQCQGANEMLLGEKMLQLAVQGVNGDGSLLKLCGGWCRRTKDWK